VTSALISTTSAGVRCGSRAATRDGTANMAARTVRSTPPQTFSTSAVVDQFVLQAVPGW
jgi:hypothetical protein